MSKCFPRRQLSDALGVRMGCLCLFLSLSDTCIIINKEISRQNNWYSLLDSTIIKKAMIFKSTQGNRFVVILTKHVNVLKLKDIQRPGLKKCLAFLPWKVGISFEGKLSFIKYELLFKINNHLDITFKIIRYYFTAKINAIVWLRVKHFCCC